MLVARFALHQVKCAFLNAGVHVGIERMWVAARVDLVTRNSKSPMTCNYRATGRRGWL